MAKLDSFSQDFVNLANGGDSKGALLKARGFSSMDQACAAMQALKPDALENLIQSAQPGLDAQAKFVALIVRDLAMPEMKDCPVLVNYADYTGARKFILQGLDQAKVAQKLKVPYPQRAYERPFYPEYTVVQDKRERTVLLAKAEAGSDPKTDAHNCLFSLGGCFSWAATGSWANPKGTTCGIAVRAILFAAGCQASPSWHKMNYSLLNYMGLGDAAHKHPAFVPYKKGARPKPGDVFHIGGGTFSSGEYAGTGNDHVGMIVKVIDDNNWETVEGGQDHNHTYAKKRKIVDNGSTPYFEDDSMKRKLYGWVNIDVYKWAW
jgi:hypothetical protein